jgi:hypothetical protein
MRSRARSWYTNWYVTVAVLALVLALGACSPFGKKSTEPTPTQLPPPTETPLPVLPTYTPTRPVEPPTATPTTAEVSQTEQRPTMTPTPPPPPPVKAVGGEEVVAQPVTYKVTTVPTKGDVIQNGGFEEGFNEDGVGKGWTGYSNEGAVYAWVDEMRPIHVSEGQHAQLMRIMGPGQPDRFVGIYQTVDVVAGETYTLSLHGLIRSSTADNHQTPFGHRIQWAIDYDGNTNWYEINNNWGDWKDTGWNDVKLDEKKPQMNVYIDQITAKTDKLTLYVRGWTKWPIINSEAKYYLDGISLQGPVPGTEQVVKVAAVQGTAEMPTTGGSAVWIPIAGGVLLIGFALWELRKVWAR